MGGSDAQQEGGPLVGIRVLEFAGIGPGPMAGMMLADLGAEVVSLTPPQPRASGIARSPRFDVTRRNRRHLSMDLKSESGAACALDLVASADALIEGFRPGVMERLGLGPDTCLARNPKLVYGRVTGWGQDGPLAGVVGHDLNYIGLSGALAAIGRSGEAPTVPVNFLGDYAGGGLMLAFGMVCALLERVRSGRGQVVDTAMVEGVAALMASYFGLLAAGIQKPTRGQSLLDGGAPHYDVYACADGRYLAVAPLEKRFRDRLLELLGFDLASFPDLEDPADWPEARVLLAARFSEKPRADWLDLLQFEDCCVSPVLGPHEAPLHPQFVSRKSFLSLDGVVQPAPVPRFSRSPAPMPRSAAEPGSNSRAVLIDWGISPERLERLFAESVVVEPALPMGA